MNNIFIDTSAWITLLNSDEQQHQEAVQIYNTHIKEFRIVISNFIVAETYTWLRKKAGWEKALLFLGSIKDKERAGQLSLLYSTSEIEDAAHQLLADYEDQLFSYADAVSFILMRREKIETAFAYDRHFMTAGFILINSLPGK